MVLNHTVFLTTIEATKRLCLSKIYGMGYIYKIHLNTQDDVSMILTYMFAFGYRILNIQKITKVACMHNYTCIHTCVYMYMYTYSVYVDIIYTCTHDTYINTLLCISNY